MKKLTAEQKRLFKAAEKGDSETIAALIKAGVDINCVTDDGYISGVTPLMIASNHGHTKAVRSLLQGGADVKCRTKSESRGAGDETALHYAIVLAPDDPNDPEVIRLLLRPVLTPMLSRMEGQHLSKKLSAMGRLISLRFFWNMELT